MRLCIYAPLNTVKSTSILLAPLLDYPIARESLEGNKTIKSCNDKDSYSPCALGVSEGVLKKIPVFRLLNDQEELLDKYPFQ